MISFQDLKTPSFVRELGRVLNTPGRSFDILDRIGYRGIRDNFDDPEFAWERVLGEIGNSAEVDASTSIEGFRVLVNAVLHRYPENRIFQQTLERLGETAENRAGTGAHRDAQAEPEPLPQDEWRSGCAIYLRGSASTERLLEEINRLLRQMGIANGAAIRLDAGALRAINLPGVTVEQGNKIREFLQNSGLQRDGRTDCLGVFNNQSREL